MSALRVMSDMWVAYAAAWGGAACEGDFQADLRETLSPR